MVEVTQDGKQADINYRSILEFYSWTKQRKLKEKSFPIVSIFFFAAKKETQKMNEKSLRTHNIYLDRAQPQWVAILKQIS